MESNNIFYSDKTVRNYSRIAHKISVSKGWWDAYKTYECVLCLIYTELKEFYEAMRIDNITPQPLPLSRVECYESLVTNTPLCNIDDVPDITDKQKETFNIYVKDTGAVELGDIMIRCWDYWGRQPALINRVKPVSVHGSIHYKYLYAMRNYQSIKEMYAFAIMLAGDYNIDLLPYINMKLAYNKTRPYKHGNKKF